VADITGTVIAVTGQNNHYSNATAMIMESMDCSPEVVVDEILWDHKPVGRKKGGGGLKWVVYVYTCL